MKNTTQRQYLHDVTKRSLGEIFLAFIRAESFSGILLFFCAVCAMIVANSSLSESYFWLWHENFGFSFGEHFYGFRLHDWINDVLMALFFLMVGLEIKREVLFGDLNGLKKAAFPVVGALGGMVVPALIYFILNANTNSWHGFGIPMATDIAFALGVILLLGKRVPMALKVFLVTLAVADDLGAVIVIATAYPSPEGLHLVWLFCAVAVVGVLIVLNRLGIRHLAVYLGLGVILWFCVHHSGIHATIAAVMLAFCIPVKPKLQSQDFVKLLDELPQTFKNIDKNERKNILLTHQQVKIVEALAKDSINVQNPLLRLEHALQPICAFFVMPIFAFANAGVDIRGEIDFRIDHIMLGVFLGLVVGKPIGILCFSFLCEKFRIAARPAGISWGHIFGAGVLAGIGFTMSIFVSNLAFEDLNAQNVAKVAILLASSVAGIVGALVLFVIDRVGQRKDT
ncbi:MAG: sodium/proton antiporter NhaA [Helicobacter sp.]|nr:sodium/proton antiporter NhaA [Helicobacter sp.]MDD7567118.1 sodium/proton antiporter NhaA [Helicobacter sp.]MDY5740460.1 sodium/proton antiporter NhaA [Helicobacter sp.]